MQIEWLYRIARALHYQGLDSQDILRTALSMICTAVGVKQAAVATFGENGALRDSFLVGAEVEDEQAVWHQLLEQGLVGFVQNGQRTINVHNIDTDSRWPPLPGDWTGSAIGIPMMNHSESCGVLVLIHPQVDYFNAEVCDFVEEAAGLIAVAYTNAYRAEQIEAEVEALRPLQDERERTQVEQLRRDLASMTYHDLRGLLQNVYMSLMGLERVISNDKTAGGLLRLAVQSTRQMTRMVKGLLDIDRLEAGSAVLNRKPTSLLKLLDDTLDLVRSQASEADQTLGCEVEGLLPEVAVDPDMITRVIVNLIENAIKHTPPGGRVMLRAGTNDEGVYVSVCDTGPGIPENHMKEIFDKYYRIRHVNAPAGVGLGLAFCRLAVEAHGGRIWVENGPGAIFTFTLPAEQVTTAVARRA